MIGVAAAPIGVAATSISHLRRVAALIGADLPPSQPSVDLHVLSVLIFENPKTWFLWVLFYLCYVFSIVVHAPFSVSVACALLLFFLVFFLVLVVTSIGAWLKRKHTKTRLRREKFVGLCFCVSVYDLTHVFMGLNFLGLRNRYPCISLFFFFDKVYLVFLWRRKERKRMKKKKKMAIGVSLWRRKNKKEEERGTPDVTYLWLWVPWMCV